MKALQYALIALLAIPAVLLAGPANAPKKAQAPKPFGFKTLEMYKVNWGATAVAFGDVNGDGLTDMVTPENVRARIQCFLQRRNPEAPRRVPSPLTPNDLPEDSRFEKRPYLAGKRVFNLALGDLNGDGRTDMAYYGDPAELVVVFQAPDGNWGKKKTFDISDGSHRPHTMIVADFNADKREDLCLLGKDSTYLIYQTGKGDLKMPEKFPGVPEGTFALVAGDYNGDGRRDLLYAAGNEDAPFSIRLQDSRGRMSPNVPLKVSRIRAMIVGDLDQDKRDEVLSIEQTTGRLVVHKLDEAKEANGLLRGQPRIYPLPASSSGKARSMAMADLDGDGRLDVVVTNPTASEVEWYRQDESGALLRPERFPTLQNASHILTADVEGDGKPEVIVLSADEQTIGISRRLKTGRIEFPKRLPTEAKPTAVGAGDIDGDGLPEVIYASSKGYSRWLSILKHKGNAYGPAARFTINKARSDPEGIVVADANQDGKADILVFDPFGGMRVFVQEGPLKFRDVSQAPLYGMGLVMKTRSVNFALGDVTGDGKDEILLAQKNFARAIKLDARGALEIVDQFNGRNPDSRIEGCGVADLDGDKVNEVLLLDAQSKCISVLKRQKLGTYRIVQNVPVGSIRLRGFSLADFDRDGKTDALVFGAKKMVVVRSGAPRLVLKEVAAYETKTKGGSLSDVTLGDLNHDGKPDLVINVSARNTLEFLTYEVATGKFSLQMKFRVFEKKTFAGRGSRGRNSGSVEPRTMDIADVTNDGKNDLILMVHDRINVYPQD